MESTLQTIRKNDWSWHLGGLTHSGYWTACVNFCWGKGQSQDEALENATKKALREAGVK